VTRGALVVAVVLAAASARAHWASPDEIVAGMMTPAARVATGVERAERDANNARVLLVRVGPGWFGLPAPVRTTTAAEWYASWRHTVPQGVVAVLDVRTDEPVVRYGREGAVVAVAGTR